MPFIFKFAQNPWFVYTHEHITQHSLHIFWSMFAPCLMSVCAGMQVELTHLGIAVIMDDLNAISVDPIYLRYPNGNERLTYMMLAGWQISWRWIKFAVRPVKDASSVFVPRTGCTRRILCLIGGRERMLKGLCATPSLGNCRERPQGCSCSCLEQIPRARGHVGFPLQHAPGKSMKIQGLLLMACIW